MNIHEYDAWILAALHRRDVPADQLADVSPRFKPLAERMAATPLEGRTAVFQAALVTLDGDADELETLMDGFGPDAPPPAPPSAGDPGDGWGPLRLAERPKALPFPADVLPPPCERFAREVATAARVPVDFVAAPMLAAAGAAIGQSVNVRLKRSWREPPTLYLATVAETGIGKTHPYRAANRPLHEIDRRLRLASQAARATWEEAKRAHEKDPKNNPPPGEEPPQLRAVVDDITRESLCVVLKDNPRGVLCAPDELAAWFDSFDQYKGKGTDRAFWLKVHSASPVSVDRKGGRESLHVPHPSVTVAGTVQPALLAGIGGDRDDGLLERIAFVYPDDVPAQRWTEDDVSEEAERDWREVVERLHAVPMRDDGDGPRPWSAGLTPAAKRLWVAWYDAQGDAMDDPERSEGRRGAMSKARALAARLALVLSRMRLACDPTRPLLDSQGVPPVEAADMEGAVKLAAYLENHRERAVGRMSQGPGGADADSVLGWIKRGRKAGFRAADVSADLRRFLRDDGRDALEAALGRLERAGAIRRKPEPAIQGKPGRKPSPLYEVHPDLL